MKSVMGKTMMGAASVLAALWLAGAVQAQDMEDGDPGDWLILVDPVPGDGLCEDGCLPVDDGWVSDGVGGDGEIIVIDDGWTDDGSIGSGDDLPADEVTGEDGGDWVPVEGDPEVMYDTSSDCGGCEMQSFGGVPRGPVSAPVAHKAIGPDFGPDLCIDHPPALDWICNWQVGRK